MTASAKLSEVFLIEVIGRSYRKALIAPSGRLDIKSAYPDDPRAMAALAIAINTSMGLPLIFAAGIAVYVSAKALSDALIGGGEPTPGRLAVAHWLPMAMLAITAAATHRPLVAVGLIYSTAVASLALSAGAVAVLGPVNVASAAQRTWGLLVPAGLVAFLAGFRGTVSFYNASIVALQGLCVLLLWNDCTTDPPETQPLTPRERRLWFRSAQFALAIALAGVGAWLALHGLDRVAADTEFASAGLLTATLLGPILVLPLLGTGTELAQRHQAGTAIGSQVGLALLNVCALLPLVVIAGFLSQWKEQHFKAFSFVPIPFPLAVWRVDVIVLIALGLFFLPISMKRWSLTRMQGWGLMFGYGLYLALTMLIARKV